MTEHKPKKHFHLAMLVMFLSIGITMLAFISEDNKTTGYVVSEISEQSSQSMTEFSDVNSLSALAAGNYYIDNNGVVYWTDDGSKPIVGKISNIQYIQKNKKIYIDNNGNVGYVLE